MGVVMLKAVVAAVAAALGLLCAVSATAQESGPVNLLALKGPQLEHSSDPAADAATLKSLTDGDANTPVVLAGSDKSPLTLVIGFNGSVVSPEQIEVSLGNAAADDAATHVDLLVSSLSPHAGFHSVRSDPLARNQKAQSFAFPAVGAKWIMLKLSAAPKAQRVSLAEVKIIGREGPPETHYKFKESPAKAFDVLRRLEGSAALQLSITPDEASLFADARDGKLDEWSFAEAALLVSGVPTAERRKAYLTRFAALEAEARVATASAKSPFERGAALLKFLHAKPMAKGYALQQTDISTILDTGTFNCVSSAALYNVLARRLGLDARAVEVPDHAFAVVYDGTTHADVETTTAGGFNPARNKAAQAEFEKLTGFAYIPDSHRDRRREVGELGLLAIVYYNHGVGMTREKRYQEALLAYFRALSLDPEFASAVRNALAVLVNWSAELSRQRKFDEGLNVATMGLQLAPQDAALLNNHKALWSQWADALVKEGKNDEALAVLRRAEQAIPNAGFDRTRAWVFIRAGEEHIKAGNWQNAMQVVEPGLAKLDAVPREELARWAESLHSRWAESEMRKGNFAGALDILAKRLSEQPQGRNLANHLAYAVQERLKDAAAKDGSEAADRLIPDLLARFTQYADVKQVAAAHLQRRAHRLTDEGKYELAVAVAERVADLVGDAKLATEIRNAVYDRWAMKLADAKQWDQALGVYEKALPKLADRRNAENNIRFIVQEWAKEAHVGQGLEPTRVLLEQQLKRFAEVKDMQEVASNYVRRSVQELARARQYDNALAALDTLSGLLRDPADAARIATGIYDSWAMKLADAKQWDQALGVYEKALPKLADRRNAENNIRFIVQEWAKEAHARQGLEPTRALLQQQLKRFAEVKDMQQVASDYVGRSVQDLARQRQYDNALAALDILSGLLRDPADAARIATGIYDSWSGELRLKGDWQGAVDVYDTGLKKFPRNSHLVNNAEATWYQWSKTFMDKKDWRGAVGIYEKGLVRMPDSGLFKQNLRYCREQMEKESSVQ
jgi:tetratricopeptide (TPR) repeat protein